MRSRITAIVSAFALAVPAGASAAETVALLPATGVNVHEGLLAAAQDFLKGHLESTGKFQVAVAPGAPAAGIEPTPAQAAEAGRAAGAQRALVLRVVRLGGTARVRLSAYEVPSARLLHSDELPAASPDDLDPVLQRLARGLADSKPARDTADIETVTEREAEPLLKQGATRAFGVKVGGAFSLDRGGATSAGAAGGGIFWLYDARVLLAEVALDVFNSEPNSLVSTGISLFYPFSRTNLVPYAGGGLRYAWSSFGIGSGHGLQLLGTTGVLFGRLSSVQIRAEASYFVNTFSEEEWVPDPPTEITTSYGGYYYPYTSSGHFVRHTSHGPIVTLGIGF